jgi:hypothetical protein
MLPGVVVESAEGIMQLIQMLMAAWNSVDEQSNSMVEMLMIQDGIRCTSPVASRRFQL